MKLIKKFILVGILTLLIIEVTLRYTGFGDPIIYQNSNYNYYPKYNQNKNRYMGANININHLGMRTNFKWNNYTSKEKFLFFGDSVSFGGSYIDNKNLFSEIVCSKYFTEALCGNYGVNGYELYNIIDRINNIDEKYYDQIIIVTSGNIKYGKANFQEFPFYKKFDYFLLKATIEVLNHYLFKNNIFNAYHNKSNKLKIVDNPKKIEKSIEDFNILSQTKKISLFLLPSLEDLDKKNNNTLQLSKFKNLDVINLYDSIIEKKYKDLYFNNAHLNKKGHECIAKIIYDNLK
jgi:hypothetical protein